MGRACEIRSHAPKVETEGPAMAQLAKGLVAYPRAHQSALITRAPVPQAATDAHSVGVVVPGNGPNHRHPQEADAALTRRPQPVRPMPPGGRSEMPRWTWSSGVVSKVGHHRLHPAMVVLSRDQAKLGEDTVDVRLHCPAGQVQPTGNCRVGQSFGHKP